MLRLCLGPADLARVRVADALHPAATVPLACQALRDPATATRLPGLAERVARAAPLLRPLHHLVPTHGLMPDFLTPTDGLESLEAGLAAVRATPPHRIRSQVAAVYAHLPVTPMRRRLAAADPEVLDTLVAALGHYFRTVLDPYWPMLERARRHDVAELGRRFARSGAHGVLATLPPGLRWRPPVLEIDTWPAAGARSRRDVHLNGLGVVLVPSPFAGPRPRVLVQPDRPTLVVYRSDPGPPLDPPAPDAVDRLLGRTRGEILRRVGQPGRHTTTTVARDVGVSVSSSSEHLAVLRAAGLVTSHRSGGTVAHRATPLGTELLGAELPGTRDASRH
jgi:DNA-binding transcriptional ArsR family regulator